MLKKIGLGIAAAVVVLLVVVAIQPATFVVERSATIQAPVDIAYGLVSDFHAWESWSPWAKLDPTMKTAYEGPTLGEGSIYSWEGTGEAGKGRMTMTALKPNESVDIKLEFLAPFEATNRALFTFEPEGSATKVNWRMEGNNSFVTKGFHLFMDMDKMVGTDFEKGLASIKTLSEAAAAKRQNEVATAQPGTPQPAAAEPPPAAAAEQK